MILMLMGCLFGRFALADSPLKPPAVEVIDVEPLEDPAEAISEDELEDVAEIAESISETTRLPPWVTTLALLLLMPGGGFAIWLRRRTAAPATIVDPRFDALIEQQRLSHTLLSEQAIEAKRERSEIRIQLTALHSKIDQIPSSHDTRDVIEAVGNMAKMVTDALDIQHAAQQSQDRRSG